MSDTRMHRYHCECANCSFDHSPFPLRVQTDSSCAGEVISSPFTNITEARSVMTQLQDTALLVDAEPGYNAGFHVHVDMNEADVVHRAQTLWAFALWEPFILAIATGRFPTIRAMNRSVAQNINVNYSYTLLDDFRRDPSGERWEAQMRDTYSWYRRIDRHSNLNVRTSYGTHEYRVWNSTRSTWRMELFSMLSVALSNRRVAAALCQNLPSFDALGSRGAITDENITMFNNALRAGRLGAVSTLLTRQLDFVRSGNATDMEFTAA